LKPYKVIQPKDGLYLYMKVEKRLHGRTFNCDICETKSFLLTDKSIVTKDTNSLLIHVLNYCPKCEQRIPIQVNLVDDIVSVSFPAWEDEDNIYPKKRTD